MAEGLVLGVITPPCSVMYIGQLINIIWLCTARQWPLEAVAHWEFGSITVPLLVWVEVNYCSKPTTFRMVCGLWFRCVFIISSLCVLLPSCNVSTVCDHSQKTLLFLPLPLPLRYTLFSFPPPSLSPLSLSPEVGSLVEGDRVRRIAQGGMGFPYWGSHPAVKCGEMHHYLLTLPPASSPPTNTNKKILPQDSLHTFSLDLLYLPYYKWRIHLPP